MRPAKIFYILAIGAAVTTAEWSHYEGAWPAPGLASDAACQEEYAGAARPKAAARLDLLCFQHFAVGYSPATRTARWSAEQLTAASVEAGWTIGRAEDFHAEPRLYGEPHPELTDYWHSGLDRGHLTPSADMPDAGSRDETFSLANIVPQEADNNRHIWSDIEQTVRRLSRRNGSIYVVTGPIFAPGTSHIGAGVAVPSALFKAILIPGTGAAAYVSQNSDRRNWRVMSIDALTRLSGVDPFPSLDSASRRKPVELPVPYGYHRVG